MKGYHEGKKISKLLMSAVSMVLCVMIVALSTMTAFAGSAVDATDGNILVFNSVDDILTDEICLIVFDDLYQVGADSEGRAIIGGNLHAEGGWSASVKSKFQNDFALIVGGDVTATGYLAVGGCLAITDNSSFPSSWDTQGCCNHCSTDCAQCTTCWANSNKNIASSDCSMHHYSHQHKHIDTTGWIDAYVNAAETAFTAASAQYAARPDDGVVTYNGTSAVLSPAPDHKAGNPHVFHLDGSYVNWVTFSGDFGSDSILINVSGQTPNCYTAQDGDSFLQAQAVWNYYEATELYVSSASVQGSLLAPYATFTGSNGHVNGTTIVKNMVGAGGFEYHTGNFFKDPLKAALSVTKKLSDGSTPDYDFGFELYHQNGSSWDLVERFTLKAGESRNFADLPEGNTYKVVEVDSGAYELLTVTGGEVNSVSDHSAIFTVSSLVYAMVFTNEASTGSITVNKKLDDSINPGAQFAFKLQRYNNGSWEDVTGSTFTLGANGYHTVSGLSYGKYRVVETVDGAIYTTTVNGNQTSTFEVDVTADNPNPQVTFNNARKTAVLTVAKYIKSGDKDTGESFTFQLYKNENGAWVAVGDAFTLNANNTKSFELPVGVNYKVEEISSGSSYQLESSSNTEIYLLGDATASFVNAITRTGITVYKQVEGAGGNADDEFTFTISGPGLEETFTLKAGQSQTFTGLQPGDAYVITETRMDSKYEFVGVAGGNANGQSTTLTVAEGATATFTNRVKTGSITVSKALLDSVAPDAVFTFVVYDGNGNTVDTFTLKNGESKTLTDLPYGSKYYISEQSDGKSYNTQYSVDGGAVTGGLTTGAVTVSGNHTVAYTNTRASAKINISKALASGALNLNETFVFQLYRKIDGAWVAQGGAVALAAGQTQSFTADIGAEYAVVETSTGNSYVLDTIAGGTETVSIDGFTGTAFTVTGDNNIIFTNKLKTGSIFVYKKLNDAIFTDSSFSFTLQRKEGSGWVNVEMIAIKNEQGYEFKNLEYGYEYRIVEAVDSAYYTTSYKVEQASLNYNTLTTGDTIVSGIANTTEGFVLDSEAKAVTFTNTRNTASLTINKALASGSNNLGETFTFSIERMVNGKWVDTGRTVSMIAGASETVSGLEVGVTYRIIETSTGDSYTYSSISGADSVPDLNGGTITLNSDASVTITNAIKTGKIVVTKTLADNTNPDASFTFTVYQLINNEWTQYGQTFQLSGGESFEISGLPYGGIFKVKEYSNSNYTTTYQIGGSTIESNETSEIIINKDETKVNFTNTRKSANLIVSKKLTEGSADFGEKFSFVLQRQDNRRWVDVTSFELKAGESANFEVAVGATYRVIETNTGASYNFNSVEGGTYIATRYNNAAVNGASFTVAKDTAITIINTPKPAVITVRKSVIGTNYGDTFTFDVQKYNGSGYETVKTITLKSGGYANIDVLLGEQYRIVETHLDSKYELTAVNGADNSSIADMYALVAVDGNEDITFVNTVKKASITVTKTLNDNLDSDATFVFEAYKQVDGEWSLIGSKTMGANGTWVIENVEYGAVIKVVEADANGSRYETVNTISSGNEAVITVDGNENIGFTNTRKTASMTVTKSLTTGTNDIGGAFLFELMVEKDGAWASVTGFRLEAGESKTIDNLNADATYMLIEKLDDSSMYVLDTFTGGSRVTYNGYDAVKFVASAGTVAKIEAFNTNAETTLTIDKTVTGEYDNEVFEFTVEQKIGNTYVPVQSFSLANGQSKTFTVSYGDEYRITETISSANYKLTGITGADNNNGTVAVIAIDEANEKVSYTNARKTTTLEVGKVLASGANNIGGTFAFVLLQKNSKGEWTAIEEFELGINDTKTFTGLVAGKDYLVIEKLSADSQYKFDSVIGGTVSAYDGSNGVVVTAAADTENKVTFVNTNASTTLTVVKNVTGEYDNQGFTFLLEKKVNGEYVEVETFTLTKDASKSFSVNYGDEYRITETVTGEYYSFTKVEGADSDNGKSAALVIDSALEEVTFTNARKSASIVVSKKLADGANDIGGTFSFEVLKKEGDSWTSVKILSLKAGQSAEVTGLVAGAEYLVVEKLEADAQYKIDSITGGTATVYNGNNGAALTAAAGKNNVIFTNTNASTTLTVVKKVTGEYDNQGFTFLLEKKVGGEYVEVETFTLTKGASKVFNVNYGDEYRITETVTGANYNFTKVEGADSNEGKTAVIAIDNALEEVTFTNARASASLVVAKKLAAGSNELGETFTFEVFKKNGDSWKSVETVSMEAGETVTVDGLVAGAEYLVVEKLAASSAYNFLSVSGNGVSATVYNGNNGGYLTVAPNASNTVTFTNQVKGASLTLNKVVEGNAKDDTFTFTVEINGKKQTVKVTPGVPSIIDVKVGDKVVITETTMADRFELLSIVVDGAVVDGTKANVTIGNKGNSVTFTNGIKEASLTVNKALASGSNKLDGDFEFKFDVYHVVDGVATKIADKSFVIDGIGGSYTVTGLLAGETYMVVETETGEGYVCAENEKTITLKAGKNNLTIENKNDTTTVEVQKIVEGIYREGDEFEFTYTINGGEEVTFKLTDGEIKVIDVHYGDTVVINETDDGEYYELKGIEGTKNVDGTEATVVVTVNGQKVIYTDTNTAAKLTVTKALAAGSTKLDGDYKFKFDVYHVVDGVPVKLDAKSFVLDDIGDSYTVSGLISGETYMVVETETGEGYVCVANNKTATLKPGDNSLTIENENDTTTIEVQKVVDGIYREGDEFEFTYSINGGEEVTFKLTDGEIKVIDVHYGDTVVINETDDGEYYELKGIEGTHNVDGTEATVVVTVNGQKVIYTDTNTAAKLTINKALAAGATDIGGEFTFDVYHVGENAETLVASDIKIGLNGSHTVEGLISGETYKVVETETGAGYVCVANNKVVTLEPGKNNSVTIENKNAGAVVTLRKFVDAKYDPTAADTFEFTVVVNGEARESVVLTAGAEYELAVNYGDVVVFEEVKINGRFVLAQIEGADTVSGAKATLTVDSKNETVTYTNKVKTGSITVHKEVIEEVKSDSTFTFKLQKLDENGVYVDCGKSLELAGGQSGTFDNLEYGEYMVVEISNPDYSTQYKLGADDDATSGNAAAKKVNGDDSDIYFINKRGTVQVTITKDLLNGTKTNEKFTFLLQRANEKGEWVDVKEFTITGEGTSEPIELDIKTTYRVIETSTGASYVYSNAYADAVLNGQTVIDTELGSGVQFFPEGSGNVTFENELKTTSVKVMKVLSSGNASDEFTFVYTVNDGSAVTKTIKGGESFTIDNVKYTDVIKVYEKVNSDYELESITTGGVTVSENEMLVSGSDLGAAHKVDADNEIIFTNAIRQGSLTVTKTVVDEYAADSNAVFTFKVEKLVGGTWTDMGVITLKNGESHTFEDLDYTTLVRVTEMDVNKNVYQTVYSVNGNIAVAGADDGNSIVSDYIRISGDDSVEFVNTRKSANLAITKSVGTGADLGESFTVVVYKKTADGWVRWDLVELAAGETKTIEVGVGVDYKIEETKTGASYTFSSIDGAQYDGSTYVVNIAESGVTENVTVLNEIKTGKIVVTKILADGVTPDASFTVTANITTADGKSWTETGSISADGRATFTNIPYGSSVVITETVDGNAYSTTFAVDGIETAVGTPIIINAETTNVSFTNDRLEASITVSKVLADGDEDLGESFKFQLYRSNDGETFTAVGGTFTLKAGESKTFDGLEVGATYRVIEIATGEHYAFDTVNGDGKLVVTEAGSGSEIVLTKSGAAVEFVNTVVRGGIKITKILGRGEQNGDVFHFEITRRSSDAKLYVAPNADGTYSIVESGSVTGFDLKAGESILFTGLVSGYDYLITETTMGAKYEFVGITGDGAVNGQSVLMTVPEGDALAQATFTNNVRIGDITVSKTVVDAADPNKEFTFSLEKMVVSGSDVIWQAAAEDVTLGNGQSATFTGLLYGETYRVTELVDGKFYTTTYAVDTKSAVTGTAAQITVSKENTNIAFVNTRNTSEVTLTKTVGGYMADNEEFYINVSGIFEDGAKTITYVVTKDGNPVEGSTVSDSVIYIAVGETVVVPGTLYGETYTVEEIGSAYYTTSINGEVVTEKDFLVEGSAQIYVDNQRNTASINVTKTINETDKNYGDEFTFEVYVLVGSSWQLVESFAINGGVTYKVDGLYTGRTYKIIETATGENYSFYAVNGDSVSDVKLDGENGISFLLAGNKNITFINKANTQGLIVRKSVDAGGKADEEFTFQLYTNENGNWVAYGEQFTLKAGEYKEFPTLPVGDTYKVVEVDTGSAYSFKNAAVTGSASYTINKAEQAVEIKLGESTTDVTFTNAPKKATLAITKSIVSGSDLGETFTVVVSRRNGNGWVEIESMTIAAGETKTIEVSVGVEYRITETDSGRSYNFSSVSGANVIGNVVTIDTAGTTALVNVNNVIKTGSVRVSKVLNDVIDPNKTFAVTATIRTADGETWTETGTISATGTAVFDNIPYGATVSVVETVDSSVYATTCTIDGAAAENGTDIVINSAMTDVVFTNVRRTADVTVTKTLASYEDLGENFTFQLYKSENGEWVAVGEAFTIKAGEKHTAEDLAVGVDYRVIETVTGEHYVFSAVTGGSLITTDEGSGAQFTLEKSGATIRFTNEIVRGGLKITKTIGAGEANANDTFHFEITRAGSNEKLYVVDNGDGTYILSDSGIVTGFDLKANESIVFSGLIAGFDYTITETTMGDKYEFASISGGTANGQSVTLTAAEDPAQAAAIFTNNVKNASITVGKTLNDTVAADAEFTFVLEHKVGDQWQIVKYNGQDTVKLGGGETATFTGLFYGETYRVTETVDGATYSTVYSIDGAEKADGTTAQVTLDKTTNSIQFTNTRLTADIVVSKSIAGDDDLKETFTFQLYKNENGTWVAVGNEFTLKAGKAHTITGLDVGVDYRIIETGTGEHYAFNRISGDGTLVVTEAGSGAQLALTKAGAEVEFVNSVVRGGLKITKTITSGEANAKDTFHFEITRAGSEQKLYVTKNSDGTYGISEKGTATGFDLKANESIVFTGLVAGYEYTITETTMGSKYELAAITGDGKVDDNSVTLTVPNGTAQAEAVFANKVRNASITVGKTLNDIVAPDAEFSFVLEHKVGDEWQIVKLNGQDTVKLGAGETATYTGLFYGETYRVTETVDGKLYTTTYSVDGAAAVAGTSTEINVSKAANTVEFTNTRLTADVTVTKTLASYDDLGETFTFQLYKFEDGEWVEVGETFTLKAGGKHTISKLAVGVDYRIIEVGTGEHYAFSAVTGGSLVSTEDGSGAQFSLTQSGASIGFTNEVVRGGLKITKVIGNADGNTTDTFHFEITRAGSEQKLYVTKNADGTYSLSDKGSATGFDLKANESIVFTGLIAGYEYTVTETTMGSKYEFSAITGSGRVNGQSVTLTVPEGTTPAAATFTNNVKLASITVGKTLRDAAAPDAEFTFVLEHKVGAEWQIVKYNGQDTVKLGNGDTVTYTGLFYGETYRVTETVDGTVYTTTYTVDGTQAVTATSAEITISKDSNKLQFTNEHKRSEVTLTKTVGGYMADNEEFIITVTGIFEDGEKTITYIVTKDGKPVVGSTAKGTYIAVDETVTVPGTLYGETYTVKEIGSDYYTTTINGETTVERDILVNGKAQIYVDNQRGTASITIGKIIKDGDTNYGDEFTFEIYVKVGSTWEKIDTVTINGGEIEKISGLYTGRTYKIVEAETGRNYSFYAASADGEYSTVDNGVVLELAGDRNVSFTNSANTRSLIVKKTVEAGGKSGEIFTFQLYIKDGTSWDRYGEAFALKAGESREISGLPVGDSYKVVEIDTGDYYVFDSVTVENAANSSVNNAEQSAEIKLGETNATVTFHNVPKTAQLTVEKKVSGSATTESFTFQLYTRSGSSWNLIDTFKLAAGENKTFDVTCGVEYKVIESAANGNYKLAAVVGADDFNLIEGSATVTVDGNEKIVYTNEIKHGEIVLTKTVTGFAPKSDEFEFTVKYSDGTPVQSDVLEGGKVVLKNGDKVVISGIEYGKTIVITEKVDGKYYTASYTIDSVYGEGTVAEGIVIDSDITKVDFFNKYKEPVVLNSYSNGQYKNDTSTSEDFDTVVEDVPAKTTTSTESTTTTTQSTTSATTTKSTTTATTTSATSSNTTSTSATTTRTTTTTTARPTTTSTTARQTTTNRTTTTVVTTTTTQRNTTVLGASEINSVSSYVNTTTSPDGDQVITKVLGDSDSPDTGDDIPVSVIVALTVSTVMVLTLGKKKRGNAF